MRRFLLALQYVCLGINLANILFGLFVVKSGSFIVLPILVSVVNLIAIKQLNENQTNQ